MYEYDAMKANYTRDKLCFVADGYGLWPIWIFHVVDMVFRCGRYRIMADVVVADVVCAWPMVALHLHSAAMKTDIFFRIDRILCQSIINSVGIPGIRDYRFLNFESKENESEFEFGIPVP